MHSDPQFKFRLPPDLLGWLKDQARMARRTVSAEIVFRLEQSRGGQEGRVNETPT